MSNPLSREARDAIRARVEAATPYPPVVTFARCTPDALCTLLGHAPEDIVALLDALETAEALVSTLGSTLQAIKGDRPTAHSDAVWDQLNAALAAVRAFTEVAPTPGVEESPE